MNPALAQFLSVVLHPVLMPTYALVFILRFSTYYAYTTPFGEKAALYAIILLNTLILPILLSYILIRRGWVKSFEMDKREERLLPFIANFVLLLIASFMIYRLSLPAVFYLLTLGAAAATLLAILINIKWKVSIHMIGIGGIIGAFFGMSTFLLTDLRLPIVISLIIAGLLGTARLSLGAHRPGQIYTGFIIGFLCEFLILSI